MTRPLRIDLPGGLYHVTSRGWERRSIFASDSDREDWLRLLGRVATRSNWNVFSWVLMQNHYHLLVQTPDANLSPGMHDLNSGYASLFNRRHGRCGALFQGRFKAILVERESHASEASRYIHLNPVRAGVVRLPEHYRWSSYPCFRFARFAKTAPSWLDWKTVLAEYSHDHRKARRAYRNFVESGIRSSLPSPTEAAIGGLFLGTASWVEDQRQALAKGPRAPEVPQLRQLKWRPNKEDVLKAILDHFEVDRAALGKARQHRNDARTAAVYLLRRLTDTKVTQLAEDFGGVSSAAICKTLSRAEDRREQDPAWDMLLEEVITKALTLRSRPSDSTSSTTEGEKLNDGVARKLIVKT
jgi:putative transposase